MHRASLAAFAWLVVAVTPVAASTFADEKPAVPASGAVIPAHKMPTPVVATAATSAPAMPAKAPPGPAAVASVLAPLAAQPVTTNPYDQLGPRMAFDPVSGFFFVAWEDHYYSAGADWDILLRGLDASGVLGGQVDLTWESALPEGAPDLACNTLNGDLLVAFENHYSPTDIDVYARRTDAYGSAVGNWIGIATSAAPERAPAVAYNSNANEYLVVWEYHTGDPEFPVRDIRGRRIAADGNPAGDAFVIAGNAQDERTPCVAYDPQHHRYLVAWSGLDPIYGDYDIYGQLLDDQGLAVGSQVGVNRWAYEQRSPQVAWAASTGEFLVVWQHYWSVDGDWDVLGQRVDFTGWTSGPISYVADQGLQSRTRPAISYCGWADEYLVTYEYEYSSTDMDVRYARVRTDGTLIGTDYVLSILGTSEARPTVAWNAGTGAVMAWQDARDAASTGWDIYCDFAGVTTLAGRVVEGVVGTGDPGISGVTVSLYWSNTADDLGTLVTTGVTDAGGYFAFGVPMPAMYYHLVETTPSGYVTQGAASIAGVVVSSDWIRFASPYPLGRVSGNVFWDQSTIAVPGGEDAPGPLRVSPPWPNPASGGVAFVLRGGSGEGRAQVVDVSGRVVRELPVPATPAATLRWDLRRGDGTAVAPGLYFVRVRRGGEEVTHRLVVTR